MRKVLLLLIVQFLLESPDCNSQILRLPAPYSNLYPDTFAIYLERDRSISKKDNDKATVSIRTLFDVELDRLEDSRDSILFSPFYNDLAEAESLLVEVKSSRSSRQYLPVLKVMKKDSTIEALLELTYSAHNINNLILLAQAYESQNCLVNVFWICRKMIGLNPKVGHKYFEELITRRFPPSNGRGAHGAVLR